MRKKKELFIVLRYNQAQDLADYQARRSWPADSYLLYINRQCIRRILEKNVSYLYNFKDNIYVFFFILERYKMKEKYSAFMSE